MESNKLESRSTYCLNCGAELKGNFCHECGQEAYASDNSVKGFMQQYLDNAYMLDRRVVDTIWLLVSRPGCLTNRFLSGKYVSHSHPIKLNMFLIFVFLTIFILFRGLDNLNTSVHDLTRKDAVFSMLQVDFLSGDEEYVEKIMASERDTVLLSAPVELASRFPHIISVVEIKEEGGKNYEAKWMAALPHVLIEDKILVSDESGCYYFNKDVEVEAEMFSLTDEVWSSIVDISSNYLPVFILFTAPLLAFSLRLVQRRHKRPYLHHLIFSLHYSAFVEVLVLVAFLVYTVLHPSMEVMKWPFVLISVIYLIMAFRNVYKEKSWIKAIVKSVFTNVIYQLILLVLLAVIFFVACFVVAMQQVSL